MTNLKTNSYLPLLIALSVLLGCNNNDSSTFDSVAQAIKDDTLLAQYVRGKNLPATKTSKGYYYLITESTSDTLRAKIGSTAFLRYTGKLLNDTVFDSNLNSARALVFEVGSGKAIVGLDSAIQHFKKGDRGTILLPSRLGYNNSAQPGIPANSCLIFEIDKLNIE